MVYIKKYDAYVDSDGVVYRMGKHKDPHHKEGQLYQPSIREDKDGYLVIHTQYDNGTKGNVGIHLLRAIAYIPNPDNLPQVDHEDRNKKNNTFGEGGNLRWADPTLQKFNSDSNIAAFARNGVHRSEDRRKYDRVKYAQKVEDGWRYRTVNGKRGWVKAA